MKGLRLVLALLAISIASPSADAQVWKPKSRVHAPTKTRKPTPKKLSKKRVVKKKPAATKKKRSAKKRKHHARAADDDDFTIIEEDFPDED
jgi:hypothetical protein